MSDRSISTYFQVRNINISTYFLTLNICILLQKLALNNLQIFYRTQLKQLPVNLARKGKSINHFLVFIIIIIFKNRLLFTILLFLNLRFIINLRDPTSTLAVSPQPQKAESHTYYNTIFGLALYFRFKSQMRKDCHRDSTNLPYILNRANQQNVQSYLKHLHVANAK